MGLTRWVAQSLVLRLSLATAIVVSSGYFFGKQLVSHLLPLFFQVLSTVASDFRIIRFGFFSDRGHLSIGAMAILEHTLVLDSKAIVPDGQSAIAIGHKVCHVLQPVMVSLVLAISWPARVVEFGLRILLLVVLLLLVLLMDTPMAIFASLWSAQVQTYEPVRFSTLICWNIFLTGGGRIVLGLTAAVLSIALADRAVPWRIRKKGVPLKSIRTVPSEKPSFELSRSEP